MYLRELWSRKLAVSEGLDEDTEENRADVKQMDTDDNQDAYEIVGLFDKRRICIHFVIE